jgi:hypothetical protein
MAAWPWVVGGTAVLLAAWQWSEAGYCPALRHAYRRATQEKDAKWQRDAMREARKRKCLWTESA